MFDVALFIAFICTIVQLAKDSCAKEIPAENWANMELYYKDIADGVPQEQRMKYVRDGRYKQTTNYPEPHRNPETGKIMIENCKLYNEDLIKYGAVQTKKWVEQGKYNLEGEELQKENERIRKMFGL
jgi:hypothetical protein